jgi:peptide/nickel transport system permease protein
VILREIAPNVAIPLLAYGLVLISTTIILEASLSFLGLGIQPPKPSWGNIIAESQLVLEQHPQAMLIPAAILFVTVFAFNRLAEVGLHHELRETAL